MDYDPVVFQHIVECLATQQQHNLDHFIMLLTDSNRCMARIHDNTQCTRKCKDSLNRLCGSHANSLPYGRIDDIEGIKLTEKKIKGRKSKTSSDCDLDKIDLSNYIKTELILIEDTEYLVDDNGVIFENNDTNTILGRKLPDGQYTWF